MDVQVFLLTSSISFSFTKTAIYPVNLKGKPLALNLTVKYRCTYPFRLGFHFTTYNNADYIEYLKAKLCNAIVDILDLRFGYRAYSYLATDFNSQKKITGHFSHFEKHSL